MNIRRKFVVAVGACALATPLVSLSQGQKQRIYRVGILRSGRSGIVDRALDAFVEGLRDLGYVEGKNIVFERRFAEGQFDRLPSLAAELVQLKVDVIFASNTVSTRAAQQVAGSTPIVFATVSDPVGSGFVASLARPGGTITGTTEISSDLSAKRLQLLKEMSPKIARIAIFTTREPQVAKDVAETQRAAKLLGMDALAIEVAGSDDFERALAQLRLWRADSIVLADTAAYGNQNMGKLMVDFVTPIGVPAIVRTQAQVRWGGLMSYGTDNRALFRRAAYYVDRILKGTKPADLPVEQPMTFELTLNMKTAKALGLKIPPEILVRATTVIE